MSEPTGGLAAQRERLLRLAPRERLSALEGATDPAALVRSLPAQDLFLTIAEIGLDDALPLLAHASLPQLEFLLDIDAWDRDAFVPARLGRWLAALCEANPDRVARWLGEGDESAVVLALSRVFRVFKLDESADQAFWPPDRPLPTLDGTYFLEAREGIAEDTAAVLWDALTRLRSVRSAAYEALLEQVLWAVPAELEEGAYERHASRLAEKGFPPFEEAVEVWAAGPEANAAARRRLGERALATAPPELFETAPSDAPGTPAPRHLPVPLGDAGGGLVSGLVGLPPAEQARVLGELLRVGNRFAVSSLAPLGDLDTHREGLRLALSHASLGISELAGERGDAAARALLSVVPIPDVVRAGTGAVLERAERARRLADGWLARVDDGRQRLDSELEELLTALLLPRPMYGAPGSPPRPFRQPGELAAADEALAAIEALGGLVETTLGIGADGRWPEIEPLPAARSGAKDIDWSAVAITSIARAALGDPPRPLPLSRSEARRALDRLLEAERPRRATACFFDRARELGLGAAAQYLERKLIEEVGELPAEQPIDPRFTRTLLVSDAS